MKIFGREPAVLLALVAAAIKMIAAFWIDLTIDQQAIINALVAAIVGCVVAITVKDGIVAALLGTAQAILALAIGFGLDVSAENQAVIMSFVGLALGMFERTQVVAPVPPPAVSSGTRTRLL